MATQTINFGLTLGATKAGLTDLRAQLLDGDSVASGSPITSGFVEVGGGNYTWTHAFDTTFSGFVKFYGVADGVGSPYFTLAVTGNGEADIAPSAEADTVNAYLYTKDRTGTPVSGKVVSYRLVSSPDGAGGSIPDDTYTVTSDADGLAQITMLRLGYYQYWIGNGRPKTVHVTAETADPYELPQVVE